MKYQHKGNFEKAIDELKKDSNNAVAQVYDSFNNRLTKTIACNSTISHYNTSRKNNCIFNICILINIDSIK